MPSEDRHINFALMRDRVLANQGKEYWRSLEEFANTDEFREFISREYPHQADEWDDPVSRRTFIKIMGASLALAGLSGCVYQPPESIVPYVSQPEEIVPGKALYFATAFTLGGVATGVLVRSNEGRPTKIEGNPEHPASLGSTDIYAQASLLNLYDPDRSKSPIYRGEVRPWSAFLTDVRTALEDQKAKRGSGVRFLTETITSPSLGDQITKLLAEYPDARWYQYDAVSQDNVRAGSVMTFGQPENTIYDFSKADRILSLGADFLASGRGQVRYTRDFSARRRVEEGRTTMNRLYAVESTPTITGAKADHKLSLRPSQMEGFARAVAAAVGANALGGSSAPAYSENAEWIAALARDLQANRGKSIVIAGDEQPAIVHALAHAINDTLGNAGTTVLYTDPIEYQSTDQLAGMRELIADIDAGKVDMLVLMGGNPVYSAPADLQLTEARLNKIKFRIRHNLYNDESALYCHWHIPATHYLEAWGDARAYDGTVSIIQPLIEPLYDGKSPHDFLSAFSSQTDVAGYDLIRSYWQSQQLGANGQQQPGNVAQPSATPAPSPVATPTPRPSPSPIQSQPTATPVAATTAPVAPTEEFEKAWRKAVHDGIVPNTALPPKKVPLALAAANTAAAAPSAPSQPQGTTYEVLFRPDPTIYDGQFANNGWLQELAKPLTKLTWDNAILVSPKTAAALGLKSSIGNHGGNVYVDTVKLRLRGREVSEPVPVWQMPGQPDGVVTVHLGYGRTRAGRVGDRAGFSAYEIRESNAMWSSAELEMTWLGEGYELAATQLHFNMIGRDIVREKSLVEYLEESTKPKDDEDEKRKDLSFYPQYDYSEGYKWGMAIDVNSCVGCNACVVACQSENNIPVVGKEQVMRSREMQWLRIDAYFKGDNENDPEGTYFMPVPCMHCENAPCEPVCPVHATVHSAEGLNDMVYNRCVGTRYCSNNCPYKVRRFNFLLYQDWNTPTYKLMRNPEVSVRSRGVMEKCTYCIQRIQNAKIEAEKDLGPDGKPRRVRDGEIVTACQAVCPAEAIVFGDMNDPESRVSKLKAQHRNYQLLAELNTQPRTTYLSALRNPNPEIPGKA